MKCSVEVRRGSVSAPIAISPTPGGVLLSVSVAVFGCSWIVFDALNPLAVAVSTSSRCEGQSWLGAMNEPELSHSRLSRSGAWHCVVSVPRQWRMFSCHVRPEAGTGVAVPSVAWRE